MPRLLVVAHGTASSAGRATIDDLVAAVAASLTGVVVELCFLDVCAPRLADALDERPTVVVPALLSTGYHVQTDIPAAAARHPHTVVARHLGPHPLLADALAARLAAVTTGPVASTVLVAAGSSRPEAAAEVAETAALLAARLGRDVGTSTVADVAAAITRAPRPTTVATYLLAEGRFTATIGAAAGAVPVSPVLGAHPAVVELVRLRYDEALGG